MKLFSILIGLFLTVTAAQAQHLVPGNPPPGQQPPPYAPQPPPYNPPNNPPSHGQCLRDLCVGDSAFNVKREYRRVVVVGIEAQGTYLLRFLDNNGVGGGWSREDLAATRGCVRDICVGTRAYNISRDYRQVEVVGVQTNGLFVLRFLDNNGIGGNWDRADLALMQGCYNRTCVGDRAYNSARDYRAVEVVGIQYNGLFVLRFLDTNGIGGNWNESDLAIPRGCGRSFCVGQHAINVSRQNRRVQIVAIESRGTYVLRFLDNGGVGGGWSDSDLRLVPGLQ